MLNHERVYEYPGIVYIQWDLIRLIFDVDRQKAVVIFPQWLTNIGTEHFNALHRETMRKYDLVLQAEKSKHDTTRRTAYKNFSKWLQALESSDKLVRLTLEPERLKGLFK